MPSSSVLGRVSIASLFAFLGCGAMMILSSLWYLVSDSWLILTGGVWFVLGVVAGITSAMSAWLSKTAGVSEAEERAAQSAREAELRQRKEEVDRQLRAHEYRIERAQSLNRDAMALLDSLPKHLRAANTYNAQAETDWKERVFNPFWTSIEGCAAELAEFESNIEKIRERATDYAELEAEHDGVLPPFSVTEVSVEAMGSYKSILAQMSASTRKAMGDIQFAQIYESWRGNRIMAAGFTDLRSAMTEMSTTIAREISSLGTQLHSLSRNFDSLSHAVDRQTDVVSSGLAFSTRQSAELISSANKSIHQERQIANQLRSIETRLR